jgi:hypothetical protein
MTEPLTGAADTPAVLANPMPAATSAAMTIDFMRVSSFWCGRAPVSSQAIAVITVVSRADPDGIETID